MVIVGLTGGIATGKTFISNYLREKEIKIFDADKEAHELFSSSYDNIYAQISRLFPECMVQGKINRDILGRIVFSDTQKLKQLEDMIYPTLTKKLDSFIRDNKENNETLIIVNAPTLYKANWDKICDYIIYLHVDKTIQEQRYFGRGELRLERFRSIKKNQRLEEEKGRTADFIIETSRDEDIVLKEVNDIIDGILKNEKQ